MSTPHTRGPRLQDKVAIVTGCGAQGRWPGTGRATAVLFAREGARVVLVDLDASALADTTRIIEGEGGQVLSVQADATRSADCQRAVGSALERFGRLDVLVNNLGITSAPPGLGRSVVDIAEEAWDRVLEVNLKSAMLMSRHAIPALLGSGGGSIIHVSSVAALSGVGLPAYAASKGALVSLTRDMAVWHGRQGIRVNCIVPGSLYTPMATAAQADRAAFRRMRVETAPLGTEGTAWDFAWAALFLASDESRWISGVLLPIDGGLLCTTATTQLAPLERWEPDPEPSL
jgi:NAD(P)-dependent dehydrogenase (short-subunit alcohol dehydrogenase family)